MPMFPTIRCNIQLERSFSIPQEQQKSKTNEGNSSGILQKPPRSLPPLRNGARRISLASLLEGGAPKGRKGSPHFSLPFEKVSRCPRTSLGQRDGGSKSFLPRARSRGRAAKGVTASPQGAYASVRLTAAAALFTPASPFPKKSFAPQNLFWEPYPMDLLGGEQALSWQDGRVVVHAQRRLPCGKG